MAEEKKTKKLVTHKEGLFIDSYYEEERAFTAPLYNLSEVLHEKSRGKGHFIIIAQNKQDACALIDEGFVATAPNTPLVWIDSFNDYFIGAEVVIMPHSSQAGSDFLKKIVSGIKDLAFCHRILWIGDRFDDGTEGLMHYKEQTRVLTELSTIGERLEGEYGLPFWVYVNSRGTLSVHPDSLALKLHDRSMTISTGLEGTKHPLHYMYQGGVYRRVSEFNIKGMAKAFIPTGRAWASVLNETAKLYLVECPWVQSHKLNSNEDFINLENGLYNIETGKLEPHTPDVLSTIQFKCNYQDKYVEPTEWIRFIKALSTDEDGVVDEEMISVLQEWTGIFLSSINGYRFKKCLVLYSPEGNTGKSVFIRVLSEIIGEKNVANISIEDMGGNRFATSKSYGKRLIAIGDSGSSSMKDSTVFKEILGGDAVNCEFKGKDAFDYRFHGGILIACNSMPVFEDDKGNHVAERMMPLPCRNVIPEKERDPFLTDKLIEERDMIFLWAMEGLQRFLHNGNQFSHCRSSEKLMQEYRARFDTLYAFVTDEMEMTGDSADYIRKSEFDNRYELYCMKNNLTPLSKKNIPFRAASIGISLHTLDGYKVYRNVRSKGYIPSKPANNDDIPF